MALKKATNNKDEAAKPNYSAPALEKGLDILELLAERSLGLSQGEIAKSMGRSVSEIFRMLNCLVERGYVTLNSQTDSYTLSLKLFELAHRYPPMRRLITEALPLLTDVTREVDQSCHLAVCHNDNILVVAQVDNPGGLGFSTRIGAQLDLLKTASGVVVLAFQAEPDRKKMLKTYEASTGAKLDFAALDAKFAEIRQRGFEESDSLQVGSIKNISFPVIDFYGHALCAMTIPFLRRIDCDNEEAIVNARRALRKAAVKLSSAIGSLDHTVFKEPRLPAAKSKRRAGTAR